MPLCRPFERSARSAKSRLSQMGKEEQSVIASVEIIVTETYVRVNGFYRKSVRVAGKTF